MLLLSQRLTQGLWTSQLVKPAMFLVVSFWVIIIIIVLTLCRPCYLYWQIYPDPGSKGNTYSSFLVSNLDANAKYLYQAAVLRRTQFSTFLFLA